jgi:hypothetical protein
MKAAVVVHRRREKVSLAVPRQDRRHLYPCQPDLGVLVAIRFLVQMRDIALDSRPTRTDNSGVLSRRSVGLGYRRSVFPLFSG